MHKKIEKVEDFLGFALSNSKKGEQGRVLYKIGLTSDDPDFYNYIEKIFDFFISQKGIVLSSDGISQFVLIIHKDLSADYYLNDLTPEVEIRPKRDIKKGEVIRNSDIAEIRKFRFHDLEILPSDRIVCCFKVAWKFGLYFDFNPDGVKDVEKLFLNLGALYRYLSFHHIYKTLESDDNFGEIIKDGWFPFIEILNDFKLLIEMYQNRFDFENRIQRFVDGFDKKRIEKVKAKWWANPVFKEKKNILDAGINAYFDENKDGNIQCINTLLPQIEGIIRLHYFSETNKSRRVSFDVLIQHVIKKGRSKSGSDYSLFFPKPFFKYLINVIFSDFDLKNGQVELSRHSASHGVAPAKVYTRERALQMILILDQIYYYI